MSNTTLLFHEGELVEAFTDTPFNMKQYLHTNWGLKIYNNGWVYRPSLPYNGSPWYRPDLTPSLIADVPKDIQLLALLLK